MRHRLGIRLGPVPFIRQTTHSLSDNGLQVYLIMSINFQLPLPDIRYPVNIRHGEKIMLSGSCFSEHMGRNLQQSGFETKGNPHGILFNPLRVADNLLACLQNRQYAQSELFNDHGIWHHWDFHSRFSDTDPERALCRMNASVSDAHHFLRTADWLFLTLGSAFQYLLRQEEAARPVANCHRVAASRFTRQLCAIDDMTAAFENLITELSAFNPRLKLVLTISPVRHIREGILENNRSKARLIEVVGSLTERHPEVFYFPAYELIIDVLRDYRFYDIDLVHPNYAATEYVWAYFESRFFSSETQALCKQVQEISRAVKHKPRFPGSEADRQFQRSMSEKVRLLQAAHPELDLSFALEHFESL